MKRAGVKRVVSISAAPLGHGTGAFQRFLYGMLWRFFRELYDDLRRMEAVLRDGEVDWTVMRPPRLTNGPHTKQFRTAIDHNVGNTISRSDLATEMLRVLADPQTVRHTVGIGY
jgi:putative NADH-flavin reductase